MYCKETIIIILLLATSSRTAAKSESDLFPWEDIDDLEEKQIGYLSKKYVV